MGRVRRLALAVVVLWTGVGPLWGMPAPQPVAARGERGEAIERERLLDAPSRKGAPLLRVAAETAVRIRGRAEDGYYPVTVGGVDGWLPTGAVAVDAGGGRASGERRSRGRGRSAPSRADEDGAVDLAQTADADPDRGRGDGPARRGRAGDAGRGDAGDRRAIDAALDQRAAGAGRAGRDGRAAREGRGNRAERPQIVARGRVNLRAAPDGAAAVLLTVPKGERVTPTGEQADGFVGVTFGQADGWMLGEYLDVVTRRASASPRAGEETYGRRAVKRFVLEAAERYGQPARDMLRVARCESDLVPGAVNQEGGSYGIFQFKSQTWRSTPYAEYDIFDPRANALAAGWMWSVGRRGEWICQ